jgi:hypothetical protein
MVERDGSLTPEMNQAVNAVCLSATRLAITDGQPLTIAGDGRTDELKNLPPETIIGWRLRWSDETVGFPHTFTLTIYDEHGASYLEDVYVGRQALGKFELSVEEGFYYLLYYIDPTGVGNYFDVEEVYDEVGEPIPLDATICAFVREQLGIDYLQFYEETPRDNDITVDEVLALGSFFLRVEEGA